MAEDCITVATFAAIAALALAVLALSGHLGAWTAAGIVVPEVTTCAMTIRRRRAHG